MGASISPRYLLIKFPTPQEVGQVRGDQKKTRVYYVSSTKRAKGKEKVVPKKTLVISYQTFNTVKPQPVETIEAVPLENDNGERLVYVGSQLVGQENEEIIKCLRSHVDIFS